MAYEKRLDGRKLNETRPMEAKAGVIPNADGSAYFKIGATTAYAAVYGPKEMVPRFLQDPKKGQIRCHYNMLPFSGSGDRIRPGNKRRSQEISMVMKSALEPVIDLTEFPNSVVDIYVEFPQTDAGTRCAAICAASIALADAGIPMKDMVSAIAVGQVDGTVIADLNYSEEAYDAVVSDIPVAMTNKDKKITLLQMDGEISKDDLIESLEMAKEVCADIYKVQQTALKEKYKLPDGFKPKPSTSEEPVTEEAKDDSSDKKDEMSEAEPKQSEEKK